MNEQDVKTLRLISTSFSQKTLPPNATYDIEVYTLLLQKRNRAVSVPLRDFNRLMDEFCEAHDVELVEMTVNLGFDQDHFDMTLITKHYRPDTPAGRS